MAVNNLATDFYSNKRNGLEVNSNEYNIVYGFFKKVLATDKSAKIFALDLFQISKDIDIPVLTLLDSLKDKDKLKVNEAMAFYLNQIRPKSALVGVGSIATPSRYTARNVVI